jgi:hypothetical protein
MRSRFKKVWCASCGTMQFAGECPHGRVEEAVDPLPAGFTRGDLIANMLFPEPLDDEPERRR